MELTAQKVQMLVHLIDNRLARAERARAATLAKGKTLVGRDSNLFIIERLGELRGELLANATPLNPLSLDETLALGALDFKRRVIAEVKCLRMAGQDIVSATINEVVDSVILILQAMPERSAITEVQARIPE